MTTAPVIVILVLLISGGLSVFIASWSFSKRKVPGAWEFGFFMISVAFYTFGYAVEISRSDIEGILDAVKIEYTGIPFMSYFLVLFVYRFVTHQKLPRILSSLLLVIPVLTTALVYTINHHQLFYINPRVIQGEYFAVLTFDKGIFYIIRFVFQQLISLVAIGFLVYHLIRVEKERKIQILLLLIGICLPVFLVFFYYAGLIPGNIDINPFSAFIIGLIFSVTIFKYRLFDLIPAGREMALDSIQEAFILINDRGLVEDFNKSASQLDFTGLKKGLKLPDHSEFSRRIHEALNSGIKSFEYSHFDVDLGNRYYQVKMYEIRNSAGGIDGMTILISDVTEMMVILEKLEHQATVDALTEIHNRRYLIDATSRELEISKRNQTPVGIILIDVDFFKKINDTYGHHNGDAVLKSIAATIISGVRKIDITGRYGGEEFLIITPNTSREGILILAERLRKMIESLEIPLEHGKLRVTASFGAYTLKVSTVPSFNDLLEKADEALYRAKSGGRNRVCIAEDSI
jgi:diguanylate cyclase (GGDEF)-like protein